MINISSSSKDFKIILNCQKGSGSHTSWTMNKKKKWLQFSIIKWKKNPPNYTEVLMKKTSSRTCYGEGVGGGETE